MITVGKREKYQIPQN